MAKLSIGDIVVSTKDRSPMTVTKASNIEGKNQLMVECERHDNGSVQEYWADTLQKVGTTNPPVLSIVPELPIAMTKQQAIPEPAINVTTNSAPAAVPVPFTEEPPLEPAELTVEERAALFNRGNAG